MGTARKVIVAMMIMVLSFQTVNCLAEADTPDKSVQENMESMETASFVIDNKNCYKDMDKSYSNGYVPKIENGYVIIVLPLKSSGKIKDNLLRASLNLGETQTGPFVFKNYEKDVRLAKKIVNGSKSTVRRYMVIFQLELKKDRYNGSYPVVVHISAADTYGNPVEQDFTVYVNITDGKNFDEAETEPEEEEPVFEPKVVVESYKFSKRSVKAGDEVKVDITLLNTNQSESVKNMTVTINISNEYVQLTSKSDSIYIDAIKAGDKYVISYHLKIKKETPPGQYDLDLTMNYADTKGIPYSAQGKIKTDIVQTSKVEFDPLSIAQEAELGDSIEARVNAMNLGRGRVYNVRAELKADGLTPEGTIYIGNIEAGEMGTGTIQVMVGGMLESSETYGTTKGTVTFYYETEEGKEYSEEGEFYVNITSPLAYDGGAQEEDHTNQWWVIIAVIAGILCIFAGYGIFRVFRRKCGEKNGMVA